MCLGASFDGNTGPMSDGGSAQPSARFVFTRLAFGQTSVPPACQHPSSASISAYSIDARRFSKQFPSSGRLVSVRFWAPPRQMSQFSIPPVRGPQSSWPPRHTIRHSSTAAQILRHTARARALTCVHTATWCTASLRNAAKAVSWRPWQCCQCRQTTPMATAKIT